MPRRFRNLHALKRPQVRQDWSKENLYNLSRLRTPPSATRTFFQQKWTAKAMTRAYHNPYVREGTWTRMFDRRLPAVVSMDHRYLAGNDGSEMAAGRGSGMEKDPAEVAMGGRGLGGRDRQLAGRRVEKTPYMHMTFHPLERRLDTVIWRALFASSVLQARQFVVHGWVKVNGKKMIYPGYQMNPGDMVQVDPDRVMFATGARKIARGSNVSEEARRAQREADKARAATREMGQDQREQEQDDYEESEAGAATIESEEEREAMSTRPDQEEDAKKAMKNLIIRAKRILDDSKRKLSGKRQQELRGFRGLVLRTMSKHGTKGKETPMKDVEDFELAFAEIMNKIPDDAKPRADTSMEQQQTTAEAINAASSNPQMQDSEKTDAYKARKDAELLQAALERARINPVDVAKPYATPWKPRPFMSAFAFIPRYLEVNQNICSAVYLRHPVARPGLAEVPTPFNQETMALAFNWYLRRR